MGFNLLAFAGGAAKGLTEEIDKAEEEAKTYATTSTKLMYDKYNKLTADNKELITAASNDLDVIRANFKGKASFTPQQEYQIMLNKPVREQLVKAATDKTIDLSTLNASQIIKMVEDNTPGTAKDRLEQAYAIPKILDQRAKESEKTFGGFMRSFGERAGETAAQKAAAALGVPLEQMRGAMQPQVTPKGTAEFDLSAVKPAKTFEQQQDAAKLAYVNAAKAGDSAKMKEAATDLAVFEATKTNLKQSQIDWAEQKAGLKIKALAGDKAASKELDKMIAIEARETPKKEGDGDGKVPALGTLNSFVRDAGSRAVEMVHGNQLGRELSRTLMPDGSVSLQYIGDNPEFAAQVDSTRRAAALKALSLYPAANRDVQSILKTYETVTPSAPQAPPPAATKPTLPAVPTRNIQGGSELQTRVEASGIKYEPAKYDYQVAPDGSIQRKAK